MTLDDPGRLLLLADAKKKADCKNNNDKEMTAMMRPAIITAHNNKMPWAFTWTLGGAKLIRGIWRAIEGQGKGRERRGTGGTKVIHVGG